KNKLNDLGGVMARFYEGKKDPSNLTFPNSSVQLLRFNVDPLIVDVDSSGDPKSRFPDKSKHEELEKWAYPLISFFEAATIALERIKETWPAAYQEFNKFVR